MTDLRKPEPTASVIDTQSVKTSTNVPVTSQGTDAGKKIVGRKRGILTNTIGLILAVTVTGRDSLGKRPGNTPPRPGQEDLPDHLQELVRHPASKTPSSGTAPTSESTSKSSTETRKFAASTSSKDAGS